MPYCIGVPFHSSLPVLLVFKAVQGITDLVDLFLSHLLASTNVNNLSISEALKELKQYILIVFAELVELFLRVGHVDILWKFLFDIKLVAIAIAVFFFNEFV